MGRKTRYNRITSPEKLALVNPANVRLKNDFVSYLKSVQRSPGTIRGYENDLDIVFVFILERCGNKEFQKMKKREWLAMQSWLIDEHGNSAARVRRIKAAAASLSNFIVSVLQEDDEPGFENFKPTIKGIESPANNPVRSIDLLTEDDCKHLLDMLVADKRYEEACVCAVAMYSGRRKQELYRFKVSFFNPENLVNGCLYRSPEKIRTKGHNGYYMHVYILKDAKPYVDMWLEARKAKGLGESEWLFPQLGDPSKSRDGCVMNSYTERWSKLLGKNIFPHIFRHAFTSFLAEKGIPDDLIVKIIQWKSPDMVRVYKHVNDDDLFSAYFGEDGIKSVEKKTLLALG